MNDLFMRFNFDLDAVAEKLHEHDQDIAEIIRCKKKTQQTQKRREGRKLTRKH